MEEYVFNINGLQIHAQYRQTDIESILIPMLHSFSEKQKRLGKRMTVFLAGPPAMGKSTLCTLLEKLSHTTPGVTPVQYLGLDGFHFPNAYLEANTAERDGQIVSLRSIKGAPETFDAAALKELLTQNDPVFPIYDRRIHESVPNAVPVKEKILIIEGNWLLLDMPPWNSIPCDASVFLYPEDTHLLLDRALSRKIAGGFDPERARSFVNRSDRSNIEYCLKYSRRADINIMVRRNGQMEVLL